MRVSLSARILAGYVLLLALLAGAGGFAVARMQRAAADLRAIERGPLAIALAVSELEATQANLVKLLESGRTTHLAGPRRMRVRQVESARRLTAAANAPPTRPEQRAFLSRLAGDLLRLETEFKRNEARYPPAPDGAAERAGWQRSRLQRRETELLRRIRAARELAVGRLTGATLAIEREETRAAYGTLALVVAATALGILVAFGAARSLRPLRRLGDGAREIAQGRYRLRVAEDGAEEVAALAREFNRMAAAIEEREQRLIRTERLAAAGQVGAQVAHEIRNPLSAIGLNAELLEEEVAGNPEAAALLSGIRREIDRLEAVTESYLQLARMPRLRKEPEDLRALLADLLAFVEPELRDGGVRVQAELAEVPAVEADEAQLRQAFLNLIRNAREAMPRGGALTVRTAASNGHVEVRVADTGCGIAPELRGKVFEPLFSTKERGTGLGLALCQRIIADHGGTIEIAPDPENGRGATFVVHLPAAPLRA